MKKKVKKSQNGSLIRKDYSNFLKEEKENNLEMYGNENFRVDDLSKVKLRFKNENSIKPSLMIATENMIPSTNYGKYIPYSPDNIDYSNPSDPNIINFEETNKAMRNSFKKTKAPKKQMGGMLVEEAGLNNRDLIFSNQKQFDDYYRRQAETKMTPEDKAFYADILSGKTTNIDANSFVALKYPAPSYKDYLNKTGEFADLKKGKNKSPSKTEYYKQADGSVKAKTVAITDPRLLDSGYISQNRNGNIIEDDMGQWAHPGKITKINSNDITMKGVDYPVLGVSDKGDKKLMSPGKDYKFKGKSVTEYPLMAQVGTKLPGGSQFGNSGNMFNQRVQPLNWGSQNTFVPNQFTVAGQSQQFINQSQAPQQTGGGGGMLSGIMKGGDTIGKVIQGIKMIGQDKKVKDQARQDYKLSKVVKKAASLDPEKVERKYVRPEDQLLDPDMVGNSYGVGSNFLKNGGEIKKAQWGQVANQMGASQNIGNTAGSIGSFIGGGNGQTSGASMTGGTVGGAIGSIWGPIGEMVGTGVGSLVGGIAGGKTQRYTRRYQRRAENNLMEAANYQGYKGLKDQYTGFMENGGEMQMGGELQTLWGGEAETMSQNPYLPGGGETVMFKGASHDDGGIGMKFGNKPVEVEGGEPAVKLKDGGTGQDNLTIFGDMKIPSYGVSEIGDEKAKNKKFKNYIKELSEKEAKQNKIIDNSLSLINDTDISTPYERLKISSGEMMLKGANMNLKDIADKKQMASVVQSAILETAEELGLKSDELAKGNFKKAKMGKKIAQSGEKIERSAVQKFLETNTGWELDPENPDRLRFHTVTPGSVDTKYAPYKAGSEEFQKAFATARKQKVDEFSFKGKKYNTDLYKGKTQVNVNPGTDKWDYMDIYDPNNNLTIPRGTDFKAMARNVKMPVSSATSEITPQPEVKSKNMLGITDVINSVLPYMRPSNQLPLDANQLAGESFALASNQLDPVQAQMYNPLLEQVSDISLQDQLNANQSDFNALQRQVSDNPAALATLAGQKYAANSNVLGEQFRYNQNQRMSTYNKNRQVLNDATLKNLAIMDQQYVRQSTAKSNTKAVAQSAISSIADKISKNKLENRTLGIYENLYNYRYLPNGQAVNLNGFADFQIPQVGNLPQQTNQNVINTEEYRQKYDKWNNPQGAEHRTRTTKKGFRNGAIVKSLKDC